MIIRRDYENHINQNDNKKQNRSSKHIAIIITLLIISFIFAVVIMALLPISENSNHSDNHKNTTITELNETYTGKLLITATDIKTIVNPYDEENNETIVGVRFEVTNNSDVLYGSFNSIKSYVDDVAVDTGSSSLLDGGAENLYKSNIDPGKKVMGYATAIANKNSKKVEFIFDEPTLRGDSKKISFVFDIPPIEER